MEPTSLVEMKLSFWNRSVNHFFKTINTISYFFLCAAQTRFRAFSHRIFTLNKKNTYETGKELGEIIKPKEKKKINVTCDIYTLHSVGAACIIITMEKL